MSAVLPSSLLGVRPIKMMGVEKKRKKKKKKKGSFFWLGSCFPPLFISHFLAIYFFLFFLRQPRRQRRLRRRLRRRRRRRPLSVSSSSPPPPPPPPPPLPPPPCPVRSRFPSSHTFRPKKNLSLSLPCSRSNLGGSFLFPSTPHYFFVSFRETRTFSVANYKAKISLFSFSRLMGDPAPLFLLLLMRQPSNPYQDSSAAAAEKKLFLPGFFCLSLSASSSAVKMPKMPPPSTNQCCQLAFKKLAFYASFMTSEFRLSACLPLKFMGGQQTFWLYSFAH